MRNVVSWKPLVLGASFLLYGAGTAFATETDHLYPTPSTGFMSVQQDGRQINCHIVDKSVSHGSFPDVRLWKKQKQHLRK